MLARQAAADVRNVINLIANTTNRGGLVVRARLDRRRYATGKKISARELRELKIERDAFHGDWNVIRPGKELRGSADFPIRGPYAIG